MFTQMLRTSTAVVAGMVLAGGMLALPGLAAPVTGRAAAWGVNTSGQLGDNNWPTAAKVPVAVKADTGPLAGKTVTSISAGDSHSCAIADGKAYCWGSNGNGQLGDNNAPTAARVPVAVKSDSGPLAGKTVTAISAGYNHTCAVADGKAYCWGWNYYGQLGDNNAPTDAKVPVAVSADTGPLSGKTVTAISAGEPHS
jgi:alpha-tubulin suppressor-like RCC1 family protein